MSTESPFLALVPDLVTKEELARAAEINTPEGQAIYNEMRTILEEQAAEKAAARPAKSLAHLMATTPHLTSNSPLLSRDTLSALEPPEGFSHPIGYLTPDQIDDFYYDLDKIIDGTHVATTPPSPQQELALRNPNSVYNWLRKHEPKIFLQDGEGSEKSNGKPGSLRGAGKRASMPAPSKPDALEIVEEDGLGYDPTIGGLEPTKGKRKREKEDDGGYHPKLGAPDGKMKRPRSKKKKAEGSESTASSTPKEKKAKTKGRSSGDNIVVDDPAPSEL